MTMAYIDQVDKHCIKLYTDVTNELYVVEALKKIKIAFACKGCGISLVWGGGEQLIKFK